jgi:hypothetical protein
MGRHDAPAINIRGNLADRELPSTSLGNARQIGWGRTQRRGSRAIAAAGLAMAGATVALKVLLPRTHRCSWDQRRLLLCGQGESQEEPPQDHDTDAPSLHMLSPNTRLLLSIRLL